MMRRLLTTLAMLPALSLPAAAHHPMGGAMPATAMEGFLSGLGHPVIGPDHLAFLIAVGLLAGLAGWGAGRVASFVVASLASVSIAWMGGVLPGVELLVAASVIAIGGALLARVELPAPAWAGLLAIAGLAHGQAYAEAVIGAESTPVWAYLVGLALVQGGLALGVARLVAIRSALLTPRVPQLAGIAVLLVGVAALAG